MCDAATQRQHQFRFHHRPHYPQASSSGPCETRNRGCSCTQLWPACLSTCLPAGRPGNLEASTNEAARRRSGDNGLNREMPVQGLTPRPPYCSPSYASVDTPAHCHCQDGCDITSVELTPGGGEGLFPRARGHCRHEALSSASHVRPLRSQPHESRRNERHLLSPLTEAACYSREACCTYILPSRVQRSFAIRCTPPSDLRASAATKIP